MGKSTTEQAEMMLKWYSMVRSDPEFLKAAKWWNTEFQKVDSYKEFNEKFPVGSEGRSYFNLIWRIREILGVLVYEGHIPAEFVLDALGGSGFSSRVKKIVHEWRKETNNPLMCEHWEYMSEKVTAYQQERLKKSFRYTHE